MAVSIVGVGEIEPVWRDDRPVLGLVVEAVRRALDDAGIDPSEVDGFTSEAQSMMRLARPDEVARAIGATDRRFSAHCSIAGSGVIGAIQQAQLALDAGVADVVVSYYGLSLSSTAGGPYTVHAEDPAKASFEMPFGFFGQPVYFAALAQRYRHQFGLTDEQLGSVPVSTRAWAALTPNALRREPLDMEGYLADRVVADPLRRLDCCLINDAAAAVVLTRDDRARDTAKAPIRVAGVGFGTKPVSEADYFSQSPQYLEMASAVSGPRAFAAAGLGPADVDIAEIYDCFTMSVILQLEDLGFATKGDGAAFCASGAIAPGGALPVNTHGGLLSHSYTVGAGHVVEAVRQLRGERGEAQVPGAEVAVVTGLGAMDHATMVLTGDR
ncbi:MAG TPA: thiolase family protein [Ilumatobacter sp.]|nr:thiolase family protein [Ilumatobacter sp.]